MKRTNPLVLATAAVLGALAGFLFDHLLTISGRPTFTPSVSLPIMLALLGALVVVLALPIRRAIRGPRGTDRALTEGNSQPSAPLVNPFRALRIVILAKASSIVGAAVGGAGAGLAGYLLSRPVPPPLGSTTAVVATAAAGAVLVAAALVAENMCIIRKDDDDEPAEPAAGGDNHSW
ncbi:MAG TPA: DUF3180 domain-containing protein [Microbacterium sp.]|nr:DUF3180 domain-containing protein [Microbacterium sp.]